MKTDREAPVGVFDSGVGGLTVAREIMRNLPSEKIVYFGDTARVPYGNKSRETVIRYSHQICRFLQEQQVKAIVVACNTATSAAVRKLREMYPYIPIVGIEPALKPAALCMEHPKVLVMATPMTIHEEKFHVLMERYKEKAQILPLPCPGLMDFIERGDLDGEDLHKYLEDLLYSYRENQVDAAVLGCTHYPFARKQIQQVLGENVKIFDGGEGTAREMKRRLQEKDLLCGRQKRGQVVFENSLTDILQIHKDKCSKILIQCRNGIFHKCSIGAEYTDQCTRS